MRPASNSSLERSMIIEGFICPECQQDLTSVELLQAHFELFHSKKGKKQGGNSDSNGPDSSSKSGFSSVLAKAKTLITFDESPDTFASSSSSYQKAGHYQNNDQSSHNGTSSNNNNAQLSMSPSSSQLAAGSNYITTTTPTSTMTSAISYHFMKQYFNSEQRDGRWVDHTSEFKKFRDNTIGRYVVQTNKLLITLDKLISIDPELFKDDAKREGSSSKLFQTDYLI